MGSQAEREGGARVQCKIFGDGRATRPQTCDVALLVGMSTKPRARGLSRVLVVKGVGVDDIGNILLQEREVIFVSIEGLVDVCAEIFADVVGRGSGRVDTG